MVNHADVDRLRRMARIIRRVRPNDLSDIVASELDRQADALIRS